MSPQRRSVCWSAPECRSGAEDCEAMFEHEDVGDHAARPAQAVAQSAHAVCRHPDADRVPRHHRQFVQRQPEASVARGREPGSRRLRTPHGREAAGAGGRAEDRHAFVFQRPRRGDRRSSQRHLQGRRRHPARLHQESCTRAASRKSACSPTTSIPSARPAGGRPRSGRRDAAHRLRHRARAQAERKSCCARRSSSPPSITIAR